MGSLEFIRWNQNRDDNRWALANEIVLCALAPPTTRNSVILTGKYNKEYHLHVERQFCMLWKTLSLCIFLYAARVCVRVRDKATASRALHTRVYGTSNRATLRIHSDELKNKMIIIVKGRTRCETCGSICKALFQNMVKHRQGQTSVDRYVEGKTQEYSESKRGSSIGEQYPIGQGREIIQVHEQ